MGYAARLNPRSLDHAPSERDALNARLIRFGQQFATRADLERYLSSCGPEGKGIPDDQRAYLEQFLPSHLQAQGSV